MGITFHVGADNRLSLGGKSFTERQAFGEFQVLRRKLDALGVENVWMQTMRD